MEIKVCGIGVISAIGIGCGENLDALLNEKCGIGENTLFDTSVKVPVGEIKKTNDELKAMLGIDTTKTVSRTALLGAIAANEAILDANIPQGKRVALISSTTVGGMDLTEDFYCDYIIDSQNGDLDKVVGHDCASSTNFIADYCNISGFRTTISTACSSSANAMMMGAMMLKSNMIDYAVVGGVDALCRFTINGFNSLMILDGELCRPLDISRKGLNLGEGAGYLVLMRASEEIKSYCTLSGYANANDAYHQTASSENGEGAYLAMKNALEMSGLGIDEIDYVNLHGTGTQNNDSSELAAVSRIFGAKIPDCSSTKSYTGHTLAASGGIEAVYSVLAIANGVKYSSLRCSEPIDLVNPINRVKQGEKVKSVLSNSFGFGGNCSTLIFNV